MVLWNDYFIEHGNSKEAYKNKNSATANGSCKFPINTSNTEFAITANLQHHQLETSVHNNYQDSNYP
jgi:hypothetical protein